MQKPDLEKPKFIKDMMTHPLRVSTEYGKDFKFLYEFLHDANVSTKMKNSRRLSQCTLRLVNDLILMGLDCITLRDTQEVYFFNKEKNLWEKNAETYIAEISHAVCREFTKHQINEILDKIKRETFENREIFNPPHLIGVLNGVFDFNSFEFRESVPEDHLTRRLEVTYDSKAIPTRILTFMREILKESDIEVIEDLIGYILSPTYKFHHAFVFIGEGANGKSTFLNLLTTFLGETNVKHIPLQDFDKNQYAASELFGKMANLADDIDDKALKHTGTFKMLTGGHPVTVNVKHCNAMTFLNLAKMLFTCNKAPAIENDDSKALWRRFIPIIFPNIFMGDNDDPDLLEKLTTEEELSGLLNLAIFSLFRLMNRGGFKLKENLEERRIKYLLQSDPIHSFAEIGIEYDPQSVVTNEEMMRGFLNFCTKFKLIPETQQKLSKTINLHKPRMIRKGGKTRGWRGIKIKKEYTSFDDISDTNDTNALIADFLDPVKNIYIGPTSVIPVIDVSDPQNQMSVFIDTALDNINGNDLNIKKVIDLGELMGIDKNNFVKFIELELRGGKYFEPKTGFIRKP